MTDESFSLTGKFLIAAPAMGDPRFKQAVIYICAHDAHHAMGLIINKTKGDLHLTDILDTVGIDGDICVADTAVLDGGPVDIDRGFVLHSPDFTPQGTSLDISPSLRLTASREILDVLVTDQAPQKALISIGYSGWGAGQLENEIMDNAWLITEGDETLIFDANMQHKWAAALSSLGITPETLSAMSGSA